MDAGLLNNPIWSERRQNAPSRGRLRGEALLQGMGCSVIPRLDRELELSPLEGNVLVKLLPQRELLPTLRCFIRVVDVAR